MSETSALRPGQKVTLTGTVVSVRGRAVELEVYKSGENYLGWNHIVVDKSALTPVVEAEPTWSPGDHVQIDGVNHMLRTDGIWRGWESSDARTNFIDERNFSELWREGRVVVVYRKEDDA